MVLPASFIVLMILPISLTMIGERPSDGSSMTSSFGLVIIARRWPAFAARRRLNCLPAG